VDGWNEGTNVVRQTVCDEPKKQADECYGKKEKDKRDSIHKEKLNTYGDVGSDKFNNDSGKARATIARDDE